MTESHHEAATEHATESPKNKLQRLRARLLELEGSLEQAKDKLTKLRNLRVRGSEQLPAVLPALAALARRRSPSPLESASVEFSEAATRWRRGERPEGCQAIDIAGLTLTVPPDGGDRSLSSRLLAESWMPFDDILIVRQFVVGGVMLDVGANIGTTSIPRAVLGDFARIYAAEPEPTNYSCLVGNILDNGVASSVTADRLALARTDGTARLRVSPRRMSGHALVTPGRNPKTDPVIEVPCLTIDSWVSRLSLSPADIRFVKIDAQGWDGYVLAGAGAILRQRHVVWQLEVSPALMHRAGMPLSELCALVADHFSHVRDIDSSMGGPSLPARELASLLARLESSDRTFINVLLYSVAS